MEKKEGAPAPGDTVVTCDKPRSRSIGTHRRVHVHVHVSCRYVPDAAGHDGHPHLGHDTDHIVPDFDDPDIPARVWDAYLRDGKITQEERERVAQHAAETGRAGKRTRDDIDTTGETQKKAKIDPDETGRKRTRDSDESSGADTTGEMKAKIDRGMTGDRKKAKCTPVKPEACSDPDATSVMPREKPDLVKFDDLCTM